MDDFKAFEARGWSARAGDLRRADGARHRGRDRAAARRRRGRARAARARRRLRSRERCPPRRRRAARTSPASTSPTACSPKPAAVTPRRVRVRRRGGAPVRRRRLRRRARRLSRQPPAGRRGCDHRDAACGRRVALAAWGPEDEVAFLALPARAAATLDPGIPRGPSSERYADRERLAALVGGTVERGAHDAPRRHARRALGRHPRRHGPHRRPPRVSLPDALARARAELTRLAEPFAARAGYDLPLTILVVRL